MGQINDYTVEIYTLDSHLCIAYTAKEQRGQGLDSLCKHLPAMRIQQMPQMSQFLPHRHCPRGAG